LPGGDVRPLVTFSYGGPAGCYSEGLKILKIAKNGGKTDRPSCGLAASPAVCRGRYNGFRLLRHRPIAGGNLDRDRMSDDAHLSQIQTLWSVVQLAHGKPAAAQPAQQAMLDRYGGAVKRYALAALRDEDAAEEVFQEFALKFVRGDFSGADPARGRFRAFVKTIVYRLIVDFQRRQRAHGRIVPLHSNVAEEAGGFAGEGAAAGDDAAFRAGWRDELLARAWQRLEAEEKQTGKPLHTVLRYRVDHADDASPELAAGLSERLKRPVSAGAARVLLHRARDAFAAFLLEDVLESLPDGSLDAAEEELIELNLLQYCRPALARRREDR
jgi:RNA polymerase sigma-70 factor (ECF subfamily)